MVVGSPGAVNCRETLRMGNFLPGWPSPRAPQTTFGRTYSKWPQVSRTQNPVLKKWSTQSGKNSKEADLFCPFMARGVPPSNYKGFEHVTHMELGLPKPSVLNFCPSSTSGHDLGPDSARMGGSALRKAQLPNVGLV